MNLYNLYTEAELVQAERDKLSNDDFGLATKRQFPLIDAEHVRKAIQMFDKCDKADRKELANRICNKAIEFNVKISSKSKIYEYISDKNKSVLNKEISKLNEEIIFNGFLDFQKVPITDDIITNYSWSCPNLLHLKTDPDGNRYDGVIIIDLDSQVVGYIQVDNANHSIIDVYVNPYYRHQGIASELLANMMYKYEIERVNFFKENTDALKFFKKNNFEVISETPLQFIMGYKKNLSENNVAGLATPVSLAKPTIRNKYTPMVDWEEFFKEEESLFIDS